MELAVIVASLVALSVKGADVNSRNVLFVSAICTTENFSPDDYMDSSSPQSFNSSELFSVTMAHGGPSISGNIHLLLEELVHSRHQYAVIHPGCFRNNQVIADITRFFNTTLISFAFSGSSTVPHPNHVRMLPSERHLGEGVVAILKYYGWKTMHIFSEDYPVFESIFAIIREEVNVTQSLISNATQIHFPANNRIILLNMFPSAARKVICEAWTHNDSFFSSLVWITYEWHDPEWWTSSSGRCEDEQVEKALKRMLIVSHHPYSEEDYFDFPVSKYEQYVIDAGTLLKAVFAWMKGRSCGSSNFRDHVNNISFIGRSGLVSFKDGIRQLKEVSIKLYRDSSLIRIGTVLVQRHASFRYVASESHKTVWGDPNPPWDGIPEKRLNPPLLPLLILCYIYSSIGIIFAIACLTFNIIFRKTRLIQLTSPNLNYVIIAGALVMQFSSFTFFHLPGISNGLLAAVCNLRVILLSTGFTLCYIPINAKMWRVYHICRKPNPSMKKLVIKDWHLILLVLTIVAVELVSFGIIVSIKSARYFPLVIPDRENPGFHYIENLSVKYYVRRCYSPAENYFLPVFIGSKVLIQFIGVILAFSIRRVKIKGLNDSRQISTILYITTAIIFTVTVVIFIFGDYINVDGVANSLNATTGALCVLGLIFIPKMISLYRDPKGERIFTRNETHIKTQTENDQKMVIKSYEKRIHDLEEQLSQCKGEKILAQDGTKEADGK